MADSARPRPRPRPKPRPATSNAAELSSSSNGILPNSQPSPSKFVINDSDDLFVINRGRTTKTWKKLDDNNKVNALADTESNDGPSTPRRKRAKKETTPKWHKDSKTAIRMLSVGTSEDSDSDIEIVRDLSSPAKKILLNSNKRKRQKDRSRSRSITPPPELPVQVLINARNVVRRALDKPRARSPLAIDDFEGSTDTITLDPELERIAKAANSNSVMGIAKSRSGDENIVATVKWRKHPLNAGEREGAWQYDILRDESFRELFENVAEDAQILVKNLVISYQNKRIFPSTTPQAFNIWGEAEFVACHQSTYEYLRQHTRELNQSPVKPRTLIPSPTDPKPVILSDTSDDDLEISGGPPFSKSPYQLSASTRPPSIAPIATTFKPTVPPSQPAQSARDSDAESDAAAAAAESKFKLVLRSKVTKDINLIVRPTTKCRAIVKAFLKKAGLEEKYSHVFNEGGAAATAAPKQRGRRATKAQTKLLPDPRLSVDGDKMDNDAEIGDADLDDGDMVEVVGLDA